MLATPAKSFAGSYGRFLFTTEAMVWPLEVSIKVPSGAPLAMLCAPAMPGRFSTMTGCPHFDDSRWLMARARISVVLPAEKGTTNFTAAVGHVD